MIRTPAGESFLDKKDERRKRLFQEQDGIETFSESEEETPIDKEEPEKTSDKAGPSARSTTFINSEFITQRKGTSSTRDEALGKGVEDLIKNHLRDQKGEQKENHELLKKIEKFLEESMTKETTMNTSQQTSFKSFLKSLFVFHGDPVNLQRFLFIGDCAMKECRSVEDEELLINQLLVHLDGATYNKVALHKTYKGYEDLKNDLIKMCGTVRSVSNIRDEITSLRQGARSLVEYGSRATQLLSEIQMATYSQYSRRVAESTQEMNEEMVTNAYIKGLPEGLRIMVASGQYQDLRTAVSRAESFQAGGFVSERRDNWQEQNFYGNRSSSYSRPQSRVNIESRPQPRVNLDSRPQQRVHFDPRPQQRVNFDSRPQQRVTYDSRPQSRPNIEPRRRINMMSLPQPERLFVKMDTGLNDNPLILLVDTGSDISIINSNLVNHEEPCETRDVIFGKTPIKAKGPVYTMIQWEEKSFLTCPFLIACGNELPQDGILGLDFMKKYEAIIQTKEGKMTVSHGGVSMTWDLVNEDEAARASHIAVATQVIKDDAGTNLNEEAELEGGVADFEETGSEEADDIFSDEEWDITTSGPSPCYSPNPDYIPMSRTPSFDESYFDYDSEDEPFTSDEKVNALLNSFRDIMHKEGDALTATTKYKADITLIKQVDEETGTLIEARPVFTKAYPIPNGMWKEVTKQVKEMEKDGIISQVQESTPWNSPVHVVSKKPKADGTKQYRMVIDYRNVNKVIVGDQWPLPRITDLINRLNGVKFFSTIDLKSGYHQIEFAPGRGAIAAFSIPGMGQFVPNRLLFGLKTSPAQFQRMMDNLARELPEGTCMVYIDDLLVLGKTEEEHLNNLKLTLEKLREYNLKINKEKSKYLQKTLVYLGYEISEGKIRPDNSKFEAIKSFPHPGKKKDLQRFLGLINYYRRFLPDTAEISIPLLRLLKKNTKFLWEDNCRAAFESLKELLFNACALNMPDFTKPFILTTDASDKALGAVLSQKLSQENEEFEHPIAYDSRVLNQAEQNYSTIEKELLALVWGVKTFKNYLYGQQFTLVTDHRPLTYLNNLKIDSIRLTKMRLKLMDYDFNIVYKSGDKNSVADALSRILLKPREKDDTVNVKINATTRSMTTVNQLQDDPNKKLKTTHEEVANPVVTEGNRVRAEDRLLTICHNIRPDAKSNIEIFIKKGILIQINQILPLEEIFKVLIDALKDSGNKKLMIYSIDATALGNNSLNHFKGVANTSLKGTGITLNIINKKEEVTNQEEQQEVIRNFHDNPISGHPGMKRTLDKISRFFYWQGMKKQIAKYVQRCESCQKNKTAIIKPAPMKITTTATKAMEVVFMDVVGPMNYETDNGNKYIATFLDDLTKYLIAVPIENHTAENMSKVLVENVIFQHGVPGTIVSDNAPEFVSETFKKACKLLHIKKIFTTPYHPQANRVERTHRDLKTFLRHYCAKNRKNWDVMLPYFVFSHNTINHTSTKYSPFELMYGRAANMPGVLTKRIDPIYNYDDYVTSLKYLIQQSAVDARENMIQAKEQNKKAYDKHAEERIFNEGDKVLLKNTSTDKGEELYVGPYEIIKRTTDATYKIKVKNKLRTVNIQRLRPFH